MTSRAIFGGAVALILLGLFVYLVLTAASVARGGSGEFNDQMGRAMLMISGLISALVIAELAITPPQDAPGVRAVADDASRGAKSAAKFVAWGYLAVWAACGLVALLTGWSRPDAVRPLTDLGEAWLGLAVAAGYAYFGIDPNARRDPA